MYNDFDEYENKLATKIAEKMMEAKRKEEDLRNFQINEAKAKAERAIRNKLAEERRIKSSIFLDSNLDANGCLVLSNDNIHDLKNELFLYNDKIEHLIISADVTSIPRACLQSDKEKKIG